MSKNFWLPAQTTTSRIKKIVNLTLEGKVSNHLRMRIYSHREAWNESKYSRNLVVWIQLWEKRFGLQCFQSLLSKINTWNEYIYIVLWLPVNHEICEVHAHYSFEMCFCVEWKRCRHLHRFRWVNNDLRTTKQIINLFKLFFFHKNPINHGLVVPIPCTYTTSLSFFCVLTFTDKILH